MKGLARRLDGLDALRSGCIARAAALSPGAVTFRPTPESWSVAQVLHHLCLVEELSVEAFRRPLTPEASRRTPRERVGALIVKGILTFGVRVRMPTPRVAPDADPPLEDTIRRWEAAGREVRTILLGVQDIRKPIMRHPVAGPLNVEGAAAFLVDHLAHHVRQLDRIRQAPGFPAASPSSPS